MEITLYNLNNSKSSSIKASDTVFGAKMNVDLLHQVVTSFASNIRQNIAHTKNRGEVRGGGKKPWKQKGTGRARHGSIRSPIWKGGGVAFGPRSDRNFSHKINNKMKQQALSISLASKLADNELVVVDSLNSSENKTKQAHKNLIKILSDVFSAKVNQKIPTSLIIVSDSESAEVVRTFSNIPNVTIESIRNINASEVLANKYIILTQQSFELINKAK